MGTEGYAHKTLPKPAPALSTVRTSNRLKSRHRLGS